MGIQMKRYYTAADAENARQKCLRNQGRGLDTIEPWSLDFWEGSNGTTFHFVHVANDGNLAIFCTVEFDDDGTATVAFGDKEGIRIDLEDKA